jgi:hypothetical protein
MVTVVDGLHGPDGTKQKAGVKRAATTGAKERAARRLSTTTKSSRQTAEDERKVRRRDVADASVCFPLLRVALRHA